MLTDAHALVTVVMHGVCVPTSERSCEPKESCGTLRSYQSNTNNLQTSTRTIIFIVLSLLLITFIMSKHLPTYWVQLPNLPKILWYLRIKMIKLWVGITLVEDSLKSGCKERTFEILCFTNNLRLIVLRRVVTGVSTGVRGIFFLDF